jgi:NAD(P)H-hydrate repair Nnr-like enzyme with NAD(P)H-hydrate dehydratase domain
MPYFQQFGFIFMRQCTSEAILVKTFAHELGHGVFGMEHEFFLYPEIQDRDPNLMTWHYTNTNLRKYQWDWIQNPFCLIGGNCGNGSNATMIGGCR